jgi:hypothetical protein
MIMKDFSQCNVSINQIIEDNYYAELPEEYDSYPLTSNYMPQNYFSSQISHFTQAIDQMVVTTDRNNNPQDVKLAIDHLIKLCDVKVSKNFRRRRNNESAFEKDSKNTYRNYCKCTFLNQSFRMLFEPISIFSVLPDIV